MRRIDQLDNAGADLILQDHDFGAREQGSIDVDLDRIAGMAVEADAGADLEFVEDLAQGHAGAADLDLHRHRNLAQHAEFDASRGRATALALV